MTHAKLTIGLVAAWLVLGLGPLPGAGPQRSAQAAAAGYKVRLVKSKAEDAQEAYETQLRELLGETETATRIARMKDRLAAREAGVHLRELYVAMPTI